MSGRTPPPAATSDPTPTTRSTRFARWHGRVLGFCLVIFAFELGVFLLVFPWLRSWDLNWVPVHSPKFADLWISPYFRGALSGLGLLNIYIAVAEFVWQLKSIFSQHKNP